MDFIDAYRLAVGNSLLFERFDKFIDVHGIPTGLKIGKKSFIVKNKDEIDKIITKANPNSVITINYPPPLFGVFTNNYHTHWCSRCCFLPHESE